MANKDKERCQFFSPLDFLSLSRSLVTDAHARWLHHCSRGGEGCLRGLRPRLPHLHPGPLADCRVLLLLFFCAQSKPKASESDEEKAAKSGSDQE